MLEGTHRTNEVTKTRKEAEREKMSVEVSSLY
jgi:hypothetical protein